jgi:hypothetical protein
MAIVLTITSVVERLQGSLNAGFGGPKVIKISLYITPAQRDALKATAVASQGSRSMSSQIRAGIDRVIGEQKTQSKGAK